MLALFGGWDWGSDGGGGERRGFLSLSGLREGLAFRGTGSRPVGLAIRCLTEQRRGMGCYRPVTYVMGFFIRSFSCESRYVDEGMRGDAGNVSGKEHVGGKKGILGS